MCVRWFETAGRFTSTPRTVPRHGEQHFVSRGILLNRETQSGIMNTIFTHHKECVIMKIAIGSDHGGLELKKAIIAKYKDAEFLDLGPETADPCDYPDYADDVAEAVARG